MKNLTLVSNKRSIKGFFPLKEKIDRYSTLEVEVYYSLGGMNYFSGTTQPRGYKVGFQPCNHGENTTEYTMMSGNPKVEGGYVGIESANRFNAKRLAELAELVDPKVQEIVKAYESEDKEALIKLCRVGKGVSISVAKPVDTYQKSSMMILTEEVKKSLPALGSQDGKNPNDVKVVVKFFDPTGSWTWYATEGEKTGEVIQEGAFKGEDDYKFFGYVKGFEGELGYFTLGQLSTAKGLAKGLAALPIERDRHFNNKTLAEVM